MGFEELLGIGGARKRENVKRRERDSNPRYGFP